MLMDVFHLLRGRPLWDAGVTIVHPSAFLGLSSPPFSDLRPFFFEPFSSSVLIPSGGSSALLSNSSLTFLVSPFPLQSFSFH